MTELDKMLDALRKDPNDKASQSAYYDFFLNSTFWVPTLSAEQAQEVAPEAAAAGETLPLVVAADGIDYLMLFDTPERMGAWSKSDVSFVEVPGYFLAETTVPPLNWALNVGTDYSKRFVPDEIAWLRQVAEQCKAAADAREGEATSVPVSQE